MRTCSFLGTGTVKAVFSAFPCFKGLLELSVSRFSNTATFELRALKQLAIMDQSKLTTFWEIYHKA